MIEILAMEDADEYRQRTDTPPEDLLVLVYINGRYKDATFDEVPYTAFWTDKGWDVISDVPFDEYEVLAWRHIPDYEQEGVR